MGIRPEATTGCRVEAWNGDSVVVPRMQARVDPPASLVVGRGGVDQEIRAATLSENAYLLPFHALRLARLQRPPVEVPVLVELHGQEALVVRTTRAVTAKAMRTAIRTVPDAVSVGVCRTRVHAVSRERELPVASTCGDDTSVPLKRHVGGSVVAGEEVSCPKAVASERVVRRPARVEAQD